MTRWRVLDSVCGSVEGLSLGLLFRGGPVTPSVTRWRVYDSVEGLCLIGGFVTRGGSVTRPVTPSVTRWRVYDSVEGLCLIGGFVTPGGSVTQSVFPDN